MFRKSNLLIKQFRRSNVVKSSRSIQKSMFPNQIQMNFRFYSSNIERISILRSQAQVYQEIGEHRKAESALLATLNLLKNETDVESKITTAFTKLDLAFTLQYQMNVLGEDALTDSASLYSEGLETLFNLLNEHEDSVDAFNVARHVSNYAEILAHLDKFDDAQAQIKKAIEFYRKVLGENSEYEALLLSNSAILHFTNDEKAMALELAEKAYEMFANKIGFNSQYFLHIEANLKLITSKVKKIALDKVELKPIELKRLVEPPTKQLVEETEKLSELAEKWKKDAIPGQIDPNGVMMDKDFTKRVLSIYLNKLNKDNKLPDYRVKHWLQTETTVHGKLESK